MLDLASQEARLSKIQKDLESWHSLIPYCVTMNYSTTRQDFRNNGVQQVESGTFVQGLTVSSTASPCLLCNSSPFIPRLDDTSFNDC